MREDALSLNVISSRIRLARNVEGMPFPKFDKAGASERMLDVIKDAYIAAKKLYDCDLYLMSRLSREQKTALVERHVISLQLANNTATGAVIIERGEENVSIMLNEEDRIREQCVMDGYCLLGAYEKLLPYDELLLSSLPVAYDDRLGFLTACPTNVGTGMRASVMLFLPALKLAGAIEDAVKTFTLRYGLTVRGVFGEGSSALGDMYQLSNTRTLGVSEREIIEQVGAAAEVMCTAEHRALERLMQSDGVRLKDRISRSFAALRSAYRLSSSELLELISDVKIGAITGLLPIRDIRMLDKLILLCTPSSLRMGIGEMSCEERDEVRADLVRKILGEEDL